ncbi:TPA: hypothetical protein ACWLUJ_006152 [Pseudomonas aeruginosa]|nr:hypothetical protein [Pseudomonas aeruginosa]
MIGIENALSGNGCMGQVYQDWIEGLANPKTTEERMLQTVALSVVDPVTYECPIDLLRHLAPASCYKAKAIISATKIPAQLEVLWKMSTDADLAFGHDTKYIQVYPPSGRVVIRLKGQPLLRSPIVNLNNLGPTRFYQRLRFFRDRMLWSLSNPTATPELSRPLVGDPKACRGLLLNLMTQQQIDRVAQPQSSQDRAFQEIVLHLADPAVYASTMEKLADLSKVDLDAFFAVLTSLDAPEVRGALANLAEDADRAFISKSGFTDRIKSGYRVRVRKGNERIRASVCIAEFGEVRAKKRVRFLRDRIMFEVARNSSPEIMIPLVGLQFEEASRKGAEHLCLTFRYTCPESGRYRSFQQSCRKNGFMGAFHKIRGAVARLGIDVPQDAYQAIRPTADQFLRHREYVADLPVPYS